MGSRIIKFSVVLCVLFSSLILAFTVSFSPSVFAQVDSDPVTATSPDGNVVLSVSILDKLNAESGRVYYSVNFNDQPLILDSSFGLGFKGAAPFAANLQINDIQRRAVDENWQRYWGKRKNVRNHYNEVSVELVEAQAPNRSVNLVFRIFDDGVAFRYFLPEDWGEFKLSSEQTEFQFTGLPTSWAVNFNSYTTSQEVQFLQTPLQDLKPSGLYGIPLLVQASESAWVAIAEADLSDWAGMYLKGSGTTRNQVLTSLSPLPEEPDVIVSSTAPRNSPWRMIMIGEQAGDMIESDMLQNLNDPAIGDFSWVEPGIASWNWWNGPYLPDVDFEVGMNTDTMKAFVDLSAEMNWDYVLVDAGWYEFGSPGSDSLVRPDARITQVIPELDMPELISYAHERDVKLIVWLHWSNVDTDMEEAFPLYEEWGISGIKIDFMDSDNQQMVNFYHRVADLAAKHHLLVDFHGAYKPTGVSRTYPNLITREGVLGNEYNKWSLSVSPEHTVTIPFTRGMLGEMDFTPGGFRNRTPATFRPVNLGPYVMGTRVHELAMFVVYESSLHVASDSPYAYQVSPAGTDFLKIVPSTWDDVKIVQGIPGDFITTARRSGDEWFVASMTDERPRTLTIPLDFLESGRYKAEIWADAYEARDFPDRLVKQEFTVTAADSLEAVMAPAGGHIIHLTPL